MLNREDLEAREDRILHRLAVRSRLSRGRRLPEEEDPLRTPFQRDRDRILHSSAFRRLQQKTQVLPATSGDHHRTRLTHSLEVSQLARSACLTLRLNPDLAEAVALAHDLGHPPFGHAGEEALHGLMEDSGGFRHNAQVLRLVDRLESRFPPGFGLNLCWETRASLLKREPPRGFPLEEDLRLEARPYLEGQIVDACDRLAYACHDMEDALRTGLVSWEAFAGLDLPSEARRRTAEKIRELDPRREPSPQELRQRTTSSMISLLVHDLVLQTFKALEEARSLGGPEEARGRILPRHSPERSRELRELSSLLDERFYKHPGVLRGLTEATGKMTRLFESFLDRPGNLPAHVRGNIESEGLERTVCDYVAGMTDRYVEELSG